MQRFSMQIQPVFGREDQPAALTINRRLIAIQNIGHAGARNGATHMKKGWNSRSAQFSGLPTDGQAEG
jgi:hypothetical protein